MPLCCDSSRRAELRLVKQSQKDVAPIRSVHSKIVVLCLCLRSVAAQPDARTSAAAELALGVRANEKGSTEEALCHFQRAVSIDPGFIDAYLAIGTTADFWCGQGGPLCALARQAYQKVLELDGTHPEASKNLAWALYANGQLDESESYYRKALAQRGNDPDLLCAVAAIDADRVWRDLGLIKSHLHHPKRPLIDSPSCPAVRARDLSRIEEGITLVKRVLEKGDYSEPMGFLSWLYDERAEVQCGDRRGYKTDKKIARDWDARRQRLWKKGLSDILSFRCPPAPPPMRKN